MKIKIVRSKFLEGLKTVQNVVAAKGSMQIIQNVLLEAKDGRLLMTTTDLDVSIRSVVECEVEHGGATTLPAKLLAGTISKVAEGPVVLESDGQDRAVIKASSAVFKLAGMSAADFPKLPEDQDTFAYSFSQMTLREMLRKTAYAASQDETRKTLKGVLMSFKDGKVTMVATDGRRLALVEHETDFPAEAERDVVLPTKVVAELQRALSSEGDVKVTIEKSQVSFNLGNTRIYSKLLDEVYPNYRQVIPSECAERVVVERKVLLEALDRVSVMTQEESNSVKLTFDANELVVTSGSSTMGEARDLVPIKYSGSRIEITFNPTFVMDPLKAIDEDEVSIELNNGSSPALIRCSVPFLYVMMPLRIN